MLILCIDTPFITLTNLVSTVTETKDEFLKMYLL